MYLEVSIEVIFQEWNKFISGDVIEFWHIFPHVVLEVDESRGRDHLLLNVEEVHDSLRAIVTGINVDKQDLGGRAV